LCFCYLQGSVEPENALPSRMLQSPGEPRAKNIVAESTKTDPPGQESEDAALCAKSRS